MTENEKLEALHRLAVMTEWVRVTTLDEAWREAWRQRYGTTDGWKSPMRVGGYVLEDIAAAIERGELDTLERRERFLRRLVSGEIFDEATAVSKERKMSA